MSYHCFDRLFGACLTVGLLSCTVMVTDATAQLNPTDPATIRVTLLKTKPGKGALWRDMQREVLHKYYEDAKWPAVSVYRVRFGQPNFAIVTGIGTYDNPGQMSDSDLRRFRATMSDAVEWSRTRVQHKHTDLSFGPPVDKPAAHISVSQIKLAPGQRGAFIKNFKENGIPRWKEMGLPSLTTWEILYGEDSGDFVVVVPIENYGELSEGTPFYRGLSEEDRAQILTGMEGVVVSIKRSVGDYLENQSYVAAQ